jgi:F-type H+-transporting ATPase subunit delta
MATVVSAFCHRYARALADAVTKPSAGVDSHQISRELQAFDAVLSASPELRHALSSPAVPGPRKKAVVNRLADPLALSRISRNFLFILIDHRRIAALADVLKAFEMELDNRLGLARVEVTAARELDPRQREALIQDLEKLTRKRVRLQFSVDPALIGGVVARVGSTVYDGSVRGKLESLGRRLAAE